MDFPARPSGTILVADDEPEVRQTIATFLRRCSYDAVTAADGQEAIALAEAHPPDLFLLDIIMPRADGLTVCRSVKSRHSTQHVPVVLMTAMDSPDDVVRGLKAGADEYLCKPVRLSELSVRIDNLVRRKRLFDRIQTHNDELIETLGDQSRSIAELFTLSLQMNLAKSLDELLEVVSDSLAHSMGTNRVAVLLPDARGTQLRIAGSLGIPRGVVNSTLITAEAPELKHLMQRGRPELIARNDPAHAWAAPLHQKSGICGPIVVMPMTLGHEPVGLLAVAAKCHDALTANESAILTYFGHTAAVAIKNRQRQGQIRETQDVTIFALAKLAESRDELTGNHLRRVQTYCRRLAEALRQKPHFSSTVNDKFIDQLWRAAPLHDIGKVGIPDQILLKPGKLTPEEFKIMEQHTIIGGQTLEAANRKLSHESFLFMAQEICYSHHERWDGTGYPWKLKGEAIPLSARILACADVYDALTTARPYKPEFLHAKAKALILAGRGTQFDPVICDAFAELADEFDTIREQLKDGPDHRQPTVYSSNLSA